MLLIIDTESLLFEQSDPPWTRRAAGAVSNFPGFFDGSPLRLLFYRLKKTVRRSGRSPSGQCCQLRNQMIENAQAGRPVRKAGCG